MLTLSVFLTLFFAVLACLVFAGSRRAAKPAPAAPSVWTRQGQSPTAPVWPREQRHAAGPARERRCYLAKVETRALSDAEKSAGYIGALTGIIPLATDSVTLRDRSLNNGQPFVERIAPRAFEGAGTADVIAVVGHTDDPLAAFARTGANLTLSESATEIRWEALLPNTQAGRDLAELGAKQIIRGTSFEFERGAADTWSKRDDGTAVRTVTRGTLVRVNPVLDPAYGTSELTVSTRAAGRTRRGFYAMSDAGYAGGMGEGERCPPDVCFAEEQLCDELECFGAAQSYLRDNPTGAHRAYAEREVAECAANIRTLLDWLTANGATPAADPALLERAAAAARQVPALSFSEDARETRLRILTK